MNLQVPEGFRPAGDVVWAQQIAPPLFRRLAYTGARRQGVLYERKVHEHLSDLYGDDYMPGPWFKFASVGERTMRICQPDGLIIQPEKGRITLVEVKYQHTPLAWWQLKRLYLPVLRKVCPERLWKVDFCEVVKYYDPSIPFPEQVVLACHVPMQSDKFKVHIWQ